MSTSLLVVTLDSAEPELVRRWAAEGDLPTLATLLATGQALPIENYPGFGNASYWLSLNSGLDPSEHGRYYRRQLRPPNGALASFDFDEATVRPFWHDLEQAGLTVAVVDAVETPPARLEVGLEIVAWLTHGRIKAPRSYPSTAMTPLLKRFGDDPFDGSTDNARARGVDLAEIFAKLEARIETKTEAALALLAERKWDLFSVAFHEPHDVGHLAWHRHEAATTPADDPVRCCYKKLDQALRTLQAAVGESVTTIVLIGPGMQRNVTANPLLPDLLRALQNKRRNPLWQGLASTVRAALRAPVLSRYANRTLRGLRAQAAVAAKRRSGVPYFALPNNDNAGAVRINLAGRDPGGIVPAARYAAECDALEQRLRTVKDASGNVALVTDVVQLRKSYSGDALTYLPDLLVTWNPAADVSAAQATEFGRIEAPRLPTRTGDHSERGLLLANRALADDVAGTLRPHEATPILLAAAHAAYSARAAGEAAE